MKLSITASALLLASGLEAQQPGSPAPGNIPEVLPLADEIALAISAAPEYLRAGAGVWVLERNGFRKERESSNGFTCIVNRDAPMNRKPTCYDAEGTRTILPKVVRWGNLLMAGVSADSIRKEITAGFHDGTYKPPSRAGVAYMLSGDIRVQGANGVMTSFPPHMMFYAPNITNEDIGVSHQALVADPWLPQVGYQGPHGYIIVLVPTGSPMKHDL